MNKDNIITVICLIILAVGIMVIAGWAVHNPLLIKIVPFAVSMKFSTAVCFICSALILHLIRCDLNGQKSLAHTFLPLPCLVITLLLTAILLAMFLRISTGIENLFIKENPNAIATVYSGHPSVISIINFLIIMLTGILTMLETVHFRRYLKRIGIGIGLTGVVALIGYIFNWPVLYYATLPDVNAMAVHTAFLFSLIGIAFILLGQKDAKSTKTA